MCTEETKLDPPIYTTGYVKKRVGMDATQTLISYHKYLSTPVYKDWRGWRRYTSQQIAELRKAWELPHPERAADS